MKRSIALAILFATLSGVSHAAEYTLMIYETRAELTGRTSASEKDAYWGRYNQLAGKLVKAGILRGGTALDEDVNRMVRGGKVDAVNPERDGAYLSGYFIIDVASMDEAQTWARQVETKGFVEVRPHRPNPSMPAAKY